MRWGPARPTRGTCARLASSPMAWAALRERSRMLARGLLQQSATLGSPGVDEMRWLKPVRGGDLLRGRVTIISVKPSSKHAGRGTVGTLGELFNEQGERVFFVRSAGIFARRPR